MRACLKRFGPELYDRTTAPLILKDRMLTAEMNETLVCACARQTLSAKHFAKLRTAHHQVLLRVIGFERRVCADHATLSYAKALKMTRCKSIETTIRKRRLVFLGAEARPSKVRLPSQVMFGTIAGGENSRPGGQYKNWPRCIA